MFLTLLNTILKYEVICKHLSFKNRFTYKIMGVRAAGRPGRKADNLTTICESIV
jgi:hypothetical protein